MGAKQRIGEIIKEALLARNFTEPDATQIMTRYLRYGEDATLEQIRIPFGKYKDWPIDEVPKEYLSWLVCQTWFRDKYDALYEDILSLL